VSVKQFCRFLIKREKNKKLSQVQMQYSFSLSFSIWCCCLIKGRGKKKWGIWRQLCECLSEVAACLLLSAICCCRLCLFKVLLDSCPFCFLQYTALPAFCNCRLFCVRSGLPPCHSGDAFHTTATVTSFPLSKVAGQVLLLLPSLASLFIYSLH
jgi:hypothetical protein